jgi:hypothetical protein
MPYDENKNWTPDPEDARWSDPDASKYLDEDGNDTRYGRTWPGGYVPEPPEVTELKKSGEWAEWEPLYRRWFYSDLVSAIVSRRGEKT